MFGAAYLGGNKPKGEHVGLFGGFAVLKNFWCQPSESRSARNVPTKFEFSITRGCGESNVREAGAPGDIHKDVVLDRFVRSTTQRGIRFRERRTGFKFPCTTPYEWRYSNPWAISINWDR